MRVVTLSALGACIAAAEPVVADWRMSVEARPTTIAIEWHDGDATRSGDEHLEQAWGLAVGYRRGLGLPGSPHIMILGLDGVAVDETLVGGDRQAVLGRVSAGYGLALDAAWLLTVAASAAWGPAQMHLSGPGTGQIAMSGRMTEFDLRAGVRWHLSDRWSAFAEGGWMAGRDRFEGDAATWTGDRDGPVFSVGCAWTPDPRPRGLE